MYTVVVGINHKTAPIEIREKFFLTPIQQDLLLCELKNDVAVLEAMVIATCNRTEIYLNLLNPLKDNLKIIKLFSCIKKDDTLIEYINRFYVLSNELAVEHILKVACGLDSNILGEKQILGQVKSAFTRAKERGLLLKRFNILHNIAIRTGKKAQNETDIGYGGSSVSWAAIVKAEAELKSLEGKSALLIGAGKMSKLALEQIAQKGFKSLYLMNRTHNIAERLAKKHGGQAVPFADIKEVLNEIDVCICASGAPHYIIDKETVAKSTALNKKIVFIDISMPRNIDPAIGQLPNIVYYDVDHLDGYIEANLLKRKASIKQVEQIISEKVTQYNSKIEKIQKLNSPESIEFNV